MHAVSAFPPSLAKLLRCPVTGQELVLDKGELVTPDGERRYPVSPCGVAELVGPSMSSDTRTQQEHYDVIANAYVANLNYPHTIEYMAHLDDVLFQVVGGRPLGRMAEICCGRGEALRLFEGCLDTGVGVDISARMLEATATSIAADGHIALVQGDALQLPLASDSFDTVTMLGGVHHILDRQKLFSEVARILKPGGIFYFREPVSDVFLWRALRALIYRLSPLLDHDTERPLIYGEIAPVLEQAGLKLETWRTCGLFGFALFMNSDVLVFNRLFRFIPGIRRLTRWVAWLDDAIIRLPGLGRAGMIVVAAARKSAN